MNVCVVQTKPVRGDISRNIDAHIKLIELAVANGSDLIVFPELSLTGYEPTLADQLATSPADNRLVVLQQLSDAHALTIAVGLPTRTLAGLCISLVIFQPNQSRQVYSKRYLHADEEPFFVSGQPYTELTVEQTSIALAICYEISIPQHAQDAAERGSDLYIASVAKSVNGIDNALTRLAAIASTYSIPVLMANSVGQADGDECAGKSSVWNTEGVLIGQLNGTDEGLLIFHTKTQEVIELALPSGKLDR